MKFSQFGWAVAALAMTASGALAQFSDSYNFLKFVRERDVTKVNELLAKPGTIIVDTKDSKLGETALQMVTKAKDLPWMSHLLSKGAKPDIKDNLGNTALMYAAQIRFIEGASLLIKVRAQVNLANSAGETPLIRAVQLRDGPMVRLLLAAGANADKTDTIAGLSARDYAKRDTRGTAILKIIEESKPKPVSVTGPKL